MNSPANWVLKIDDSVLKVIKKFPRKDAAAIGHAIESMRKNPYEGDIRKIGGEEYIWRRRVGSYRISYELYPNQKWVVIFEIKRRTSSTY